MKVLRTPDERFIDLPDFGYEPHYQDVPDGEGGTLRLAYIDEGPAEAEPVLLMHGEPTWSFLYRKMIPVFVKAGFRAVAPDLIGFGRSDKPSKTDDYTYNRHVTWITSWLDSMALEGVTLFGQDWGSLIGLRLAGQDPERFARLVIGNGGLPTQGGQVTEAFLNWQKFAREVEVFDVGGIISNSIKNPAPEIIAAYNAPFPDQSFTMAPRIFPALVPTKDDDPALPFCRKAWENLSQFEKPCLTTFSDGDPVTAGGDKALQAAIPGAKGMPHVTIKGAGHFLQEDKGEELAQVMVRFMTSF